MHLTVTRPICLPRLQNKTKKKYLKQNNKNAKNENKQKEMNKWRERKKTGKINVLYILLQTKLYAVDGMCNTKQEIIREIYTKF